MSQKVGLWNTRFQRCGWSSSSLLEARMSTHLFKGDHFLREFLIFQPHPVFSGHVSFSGESIEEFRRWNEMKLSDDQISARFGGKKPSFDFSISTNNPFESLKYQLEIRKKKDHHLHSESWNSILYRMYERIILECPKAFMCQSWRISILTKAAWCFGLLEQLMIPESNWSILGVFSAFVHLWKDYEKLPSNFAQAWVFVEWVPKKRLNWFEFSSLV